MANIIWEDVVGVAPELGQLVNGSPKISLVGQDMILQLANSYFDPANFGGETTSTGATTPKLKSARAYLAAHFATLQLRRGTPGAVASASAGGLSRSFMQPQLNLSTTLQLTSYGLLLVQILKTTAARAGFSIGMVSPTALLPVDPGWDG